MISILFFLAGVALSQSACTNGDGCSMSATCDVEFVDNAVYGCGGVWETKGITNGDYLCGEGYTICSSDAKASALGLTASDCVSSTLMDDNYFYASLQSASDATTCSDSGLNGVFGCSSGNEAWLDYTTTDCDVLNAVLTTTSAGSGSGWVYGWEPWGGGDNKELDNTHHDYIQIADGSGGWTRTNISMGGVLCCADNETDISTTEFFSSMMTEEGDECDGCSMYASCDVEFSEYVYGCGGEWATKGIENGAYLCGEGYEICPDGEYAEDLGLTDEDCLNLPDPNHFYASAVHSLGDLLCQDNSTNDTVFGNDDVFGCGSTNSSNDWICTTELWCDAMDCGAFQAQISWNSGDSWKYGWYLWDDGETSELTAIRHEFNGGDGFVGTWGGVLCCISGGIPEMSTTDTSQNTNYSEGTPSPIVDSANTVYSSITFLSIMAIFNFVFM